MGKRRARKQPGPSKKPNKPKSKSNIIRVTLLDPFTPTQPSTMHVNDLPNDCIGFFLQYIEPLDDLVSMAFVCPRWVSVVYKIVRLRQDSLKVFDSEEDISTYHDCALMHYNLIKLDPNVGVKQTRDKQEDHIFSRSLPCENIETTLGVIVRLFDEVKSLVINAPKLQMFNRIQDLKHLTSITLLHLPDSREKQNQIWTALNASPALLHVHLLRTNVITPFDVDKMDFLTRIESLTLDNYWHSNVNAILNRLSSDRCRCLQIGNLANVEEKVLQKLVLENAALVAKLTHFCIRLEETFPEISQKYMTLRRTIFELIRTHFKSLNYLDLEFVSMILPLYLNRLVELPNLTELRLGHDYLCSEAMSRTETNPLGIQRQYPHIRTVYLTNFTMEFDLINSLFPSPQEAAGIIDPTDRLFLNVFPIVSLNDGEEVERVRELLENPNLLRAGQNETRLDAYIRIRVDQGNQLLDRQPCLFPQLEKVIFVLDSRSLPDQQTIETVRPSIRNWIPVQFWNRCAVLDTAVGALNSTFFGGDAQDLVDNRAWTLVLQPRQYLLELYEYENANATRRNRGLLIWDDDDENQDLEEEDEENDDNQDLEVEDEENDANQDLFEEDYEFANDPERERRGLSEYRIRIDNRILKL